MNLAEKGDGGEIGMSGGRKICSQDLVYESRIDK